MSSLTKIVRQSTDSGGPVGLFNLCFLMRSFEISYMYMIEQILHPSLWANPFFEFNREVLQPKTKGILHIETIGIFQHKFNAEIMWKGLYFCS